jgi:hypothetical protein
MKLKPESGANRIRSADDAYSFLAHLRLSYQSKPLLWSVPPTATATACKMRFLPGGAAVPDSNFDRKRELECLRLASDLMQLAANTLNPHLKEHCLRMAKVWSGEAEKTPAEYARAEQTGAQSTLYH